MTFDAQAIARGIVARFLQRNSGYVIVHHDCEADAHDAEVIDGFATREQAEAFIYRNGLDRPVDGGYAFAIVIGPVVQAAVLEAVA